MDMATLEAQEKELIFAAFTEETALSLGLTLVELARARALPVVISIRTPERILFHCALPGAKPVNDNWARRKGNTAMLFGEASLRVGMRLRAKAETLERHGCSGVDFADAGGSFPIRVTGAGVIGTVTVSGLPQVEDHALVVEGLSALIL